MDNQILIRFVRENLAVLIFLFFLAVLAGGWVVFESARSLLRRDDVEKLKRRVEELEREQALLTHPVPLRRTTTDPMVLTTRWVPKGGAATSSDGGCLLLVDEVLAHQSCVLVTVRIDGISVRQRHELHSGDSIELDGRSGSYTLEIGAVSGRQAQISGWLRSRHKSS